MKAMFPFDTGSTQAAAIGELFNFIFVIAIAVFAIVTLAFLWIVFRFRHRNGAEQPNQTEGNLRLEVTWTIVPLLILIFVAVQTVRAMEVVDPTVSATDEPDLIITGHQWWWDVEYPKANVVTANEIHVPAGQRVLLQIESADVIHSFWLPQLARKVDMIPGRTRRLWLEVDEPGIYSGSCAEFCGAQHAWMRLRLVAHSPAEFDNWLTSQTVLSSIPVLTEAATGAQLFAARTCSNCHAIRGTNATARIGPDLTHVALRSTLASGLLENTPENLAAWLKNPHTIKPGTLMPNLYLTDEEITQLVTYLETLQ